MDSNWMNDSENIIEGAHKTLSGRVYDIVLNLIIEGELKVDQRINSDQIAKTFGVSRTPVREALKSLEKTGLVHFKSYSGAYVRKLSIEEIEEIYSLRMQLEAFAAREAIDKVTEADIKRLQQIQEQIEFATSREIISIKRVFELNEAFHMTLYRISGMPKLCEIIRGLWINLSLYRYLLASKHDYSSGVRDEHHDYIDCLKNREKEKLVNKIVENLEDHLERMPQIVNEYYASL